MSQGGCGKLLVARVLLHMKVLRLKAFTSPASSSNHSPFLRLISNLLCQYSSMPEGSGAGKQQQIPIRILDDEILGAPRLLFQRLVKGNTSGLKLKKQQLDLVRSSDGHRYRQQFLPIADRRLDYWPLDAP